MTKLPVLDLETKSIDAHPRPGSPPPVGVAIKMPGKDPMYLAWGHPTNNGVYTLKGKKLIKSPSSTDPKSAAVKMIKDAYKLGVLGHNIGKFDVPVIEDHLGVAPPAWDKVHDTLYSLFLRDPHAQSLSLKPSSERLLGMKPEERDAVYEWLAAKGIIQKPKIKAGKLTYPKNAGAFISEAPGDLVGLYAIGDLTRTEGLHEHLMPWLKKNGMLGPYDVERELCPILLENERHGMAVDMEALARDLDVYEKILVQADTWLRKRLKAPALNLDSDQDVAAALKKAKVVQHFPKTPTGKDSVSKKTLTVDFFSDREVWAKLYYRNALATVLTMSMRPWLEMASRNKGYIFTDWNQVRQSHGNDNFSGARSGRITCSYFQNITKDFLDRGDGYKEAVEAGLTRPFPSLPLVRKYLVADDGQTFGHSDFDQQEMKLVAHYEDGALAEAYRKNPKTDIHVDVQHMIKEVTGKDYGRRPVKIVDFQTAYGGGIPALMNTLKIPEKEARELKNSWKRALPDVVELDATLKQRFKDGLPIRTLGGRLYFCKPPAIATKGARKGQMVNFAYTALNYLIQPSAADQTKKAIINFHKHPLRKSRMLVTVHDEINISLPRGREIEQLRLLQECMTGAYTLDVPSTTTLKMGPNWGSLQKVEAQERAA